MGRMLGAFSNEDELDRPDLNKCPDCDCFFAADNCPICGKECPEHMRAGNRAAVKKRKKRRSGSSRVTFIEWYHSWWFIAIMLFIFPIVGIVLLATSPHRGWKKGVFIALAALYMIVSTVGLGSIISGLTSLWEEPVDTSLTREEYLSACEEVAPEQFFRTPGEYTDRYLSMTLEIVSRAYSYDYYDENVYYVCRAQGGSSYVIVLRDCLIGGEQNLIPGDVITVYGQCKTDSAVSVYDTSGEWEGPCLNMAYLSVVQE